MRIMFNKSNIRLPSQVLESLKNVAAPEPFAVQAQYVPAVLAARAQDGEDVADDESDDGDRKAPPKKTKGKGKTENQKAPKRKAEPKPDSAWKYGSIRKGFIGARTAEGCTYAEAKRLWDDSSEKASYLGVVSVLELKKRKFLPAGATSNPWFEKIHRPTN